MSYLSVQFDESASRAILHEHTQYFSCEGLERYSVGKQPGKMVKVVYMRFQIISLPPTPHPHGRF